MPDDRPIATVHRSGVAFAGPGDAWLFPSTPWTAHGSLCVSIKSEKKRCRASEETSLPRPPAENAPSLAAPVDAETAVAGGRSAKRLKQLHLEDSARPTFVKPSPRGQESGYTGSTAPTTAIPVAEAGSWQSPSEALQRSKSSLANSGLKEAADSSSAAEEAFARLHLRLSVFLQACSLLAFACMLLVEWRAGLRAEEAQWSMELSLLGKDLILYDAELTAASRLLVLTGDIKWRDRYNLHVMPLDMVLGDIASKAPEIAQEFEDLTVAANTRLVELETEAMRLSLTDLAKAQAIVFGEEYKELKRSLSSGNAVLDGAIAKVRLGQQESRAWWNVLSVLLVVLAFLSEVGVTAGVQSLDRKLQRLAQAARHAGLAWQHAAREQFLLQLEAAATHAVGQSQPSSKHLVHRDGGKGKKGGSGGIVLLQQLAWAGLITDIIGIIALGIPSGLTIMALVNADEAESLQKVTMHMRAIQHFDLELTTNVRLAALTSEPEWRDRYSSFVAPLDQEIASLAALEPELVKDFVARTSTANAELIEMETAALEVFQRNASQARSILFGEEYQSLKEQLSMGLADLRGKVDEVQEVQEKAAEAHEAMARVLMIVCSVLVIGTDLTRSVLAGWQNIVVDSEEDQAEEEEALLMESMNDLLTLCIHRIEQLQSSKMSPRLEEP